MTSGSYLSDLVMVSNPASDNVAVALTTIPMNTPITLWDGRTVVTQEELKRFHRFAIMPIPPGENVTQYGQAFGRSKGIGAGQQVSLSNMDNDLPVVELSSYVPPGETIYDANLLESTFMGIPRENGQFGTRNYYLVVPTSMCASETALQLAREFDSADDFQARFPNIDGVVAIPNTEGCGCASTGQIERFLRILHGYITHPNVGGCLIIDLGCEQTNDKVVRQYLDKHQENHGIPMDWVTIQTAGGTRRAIDAGRAIIHERLPRVNQIARVPAPLSHLVLGTECGASDSFSGITANPLIGLVADHIVHAKGRVILSEVPEMVGTFGALMPRFRSREVAHKFQEIMAWYEGLARKLGLSLTDNLVGKNKEGGLINNTLKSLGAISKGGTTVIEDVVDYGEPLTQGGLSIMQGPGGDLESVTGLVACGANIVCFSTGFGATSGNAICPVIKISSNDDLFAKLPEDIDFNAGVIVSQKADMPALSRQLLQQVIDVASGRKTWSETWKMRQFQVWTAGKLPL